MARLAAFQNCVLRKFADARDLYFIDVAGVMPRDPTRSMQPMMALALNACSWRSNQCPSCINGSRRDSYGAPDGTSMRTTRLSSRPNGP